MRLPVLTHRALLIGLILSCTAGTAVADSPRLLFDRSQIETLRQRITQPELAPIWARILADAQAYCDPKSSRYADPKNPCSLPTDPGRMEKKRHDARLVHIVGRHLTQQMETLGLAYQLTGRKEFGQHGAALLLATLQQYPITNPIISKGFAGGRGDVMRGLAMGYDMLGECLEPAQRREVADGCAAYLDRAVQEFEDTKVWWYKVHNYNGVNGGAAGCLAVALRDEFPERSDAWVAACVKTVERWLSAGFDAQGAYMEGVGYSGYGLSNTVLLADVLRRNGYKTDLFALPVFGKLGQFYALSLLPGERVYEARNDSNYAGLGCQLLRLAEIPHGGLYRWLWDQTGTDSGILRIVWTNQVRPVDPEAAGVPHAQHFEGRGLCIWRTGWTRDDVMFSIEAGPYYRTTHNQADKGHFTLYGLGYRWATDPGYANEHEREGRGQTFGHSCVLIDGQGQALSGAGLGTNGSIVRYANTARYGYALADSTEAYNHNSSEKPGVGVEHARRHAFFVYPHGKAPAYAVVMDDIRKDDRKHEFVWQMMYSDEMAVRMDDDRAVFQPASCSGGAYVDTPVDAKPLARGQTDAGTCTLNFEVAKADKADKYVLWARVRTPTGEPGKSDSFFLSLDGAKPIDWHMSGHRLWTWVQVTSGVRHEPISFDLAEGKHRLAVRMREAGAQMDCLAFTRGDSVAPALAAADTEPLFLETEKGQVAAPMRVVRTDDSGPHLVARVWADLKPALSKDVFRPKDFRTPGAFPRFRATVQAVNPRFVAVLMPLPAGVAEPAVRLDSQQDQRVVTVEWPDHRDTFVWDAADGPATFEASK